MQPILHRLQNIGGMTEMHPQNRGRHVHVRQVGKASFLAGQAILYPQNRACPLSECGHYKTDTPGIERRRQKHLCQRRGMADRPDIGPPGAHP